MPGLADPGDAADVAEEQVERSTRNTLTEGERAQLAQVNRALVKLAEGSYGLSDRHRRPHPRRPAGGLALGDHQRRGRAGTRLSGGQRFGSTTVTWTSTVGPRPVPARQ
jgi:hypothetical protein